MALQITDSNFEEYLNAGKPMVLEFLGRMVRSLPHGCADYRRVGSGI